MAFASLRLGAREPSLVADIRRDRQHPRVAQTDHLQIDHRATAPDVSEQPPVAVASLQVELEPHAPAGEQRPVEPRGRLAAWRGGRTVVRDLRRVHADVADAFAVAIGPDVDRVAVVDVKDGRLREQGRPRPS
jgi:hypothetical protein